MRFHRNALRGLALGLCASALLLGACTGEDDSEEGLVPLGADQTAVTVIKRTPSAASTGAAGSSAATTGVAAAPCTPVANPETKTTASGLQYIDECIGQGATANAGQTVIAHYTGTLTDGAKFDSSRDRGQPFSFKLGAGEVIKGWDEGFSNMTVGTKRKLIIPPALGYGERGSGSAIPPNATLLFDVELLDIR